MKKILLAAALVASFGVNARSIIGVSDLNCSTSEFNGKSVITTESNDSSYASVYTINKNGNIMEFGWEYDTLHNKDNDVYFASKYFSDEGITRTILVDVNEKKVFTTLNQIHKTEYCTFNLTQLD